MSTIVLIPGAGGEGWYWHLVSPLLERAGHRVVAPDLPSGDDAATFDDYADAVIEAVRAVGPASASAADGHAADRAEGTGIGTLSGAANDDVVVVAQSLGGFTAAAVCERLPVRLLVYVNAMIPLPAENSGAWWQATGQGEAAAAYAREQGRDPAAVFDPVEGFFHDVPPEVTAEALGRAEPPQSEHIFDSAAPASAWPVENVRVVAGRYDRLFPLPFMQRISRERLGIEPVIVDSGHLSALAAPDALATLILEFIDDLPQSA
ncbi:alpha/beta fold hydrolase [Subtercola sp. YIM 133946]|uniref:alpha/beta fold hydrolase n=1 Tax=Subtercola sp. YIM 133946 TaxID=3118909 RepID=UPI002F958133